MRDDQQRPSGAYPRRPSRPPQDEPSRREPPRDSNERNGAAPRRPHQGYEPEQAPRPRLPLNHRELPPERPTPPSARESAQAQHERTERLRAMREDFLAHSDK